MSKIILLGAGASVDAGIPTAIGMTKQMINDFENNHLSKELEALNFVVGGLLFKLGIEGKNPFNGVDIEEVFTATKVLASRRELEIFPFVGQWHPFINELEKNKSTLKDKILSLRDISNQRNFRAFVSAIDETIKENLGSLASNIFERTNKYMLSLLCKIVWIKDKKKVRYLSPLMNYALKNQITIANLNYDNAIELSAGCNKIGVSTGIDSWAETGTFKKPTNGIELLKLHSSFDWEFKTERISINSPFRQTVIRQVDKREIENLMNGLVKSVGFFRHSPGVIFGSGNKLVSAGPFLELFRTFKHRLQDSSELISIGYSFRDKHINEVIYDWLNRNKSSKITIVTREDDEFAPDENWLRFIYETPERCNIMNIGAKKAIKTLFTY